jgi:hypothetical protein
MTTQSRFACVSLTLSFLVFVLVQDTLAFSSVTVQLLVTSRRSTTRSTTTIPYMSILDDLNNDNNTEDASKLPQQFNPLNYKSTKKRNSAYSYSGTTISLRSTTMQEMINALLRVADNAIESEQILQEYKDFLLEPLEDLEAVLVREVNLFQMRDNVVARTGCGPRKRRLLYGPSFWN